MMARVQEAVNNFKVQTVEEDKLRQYQTQRQRKWDKCYKTCAVWLLGFRKSRTGSYINWISFQVLLIKQEEF